MYLPEARKSVSGGHGDDEGKQIVDERIESFVHEYSESEMGWKWYGTFSSNREDTEDQILTKYVS